MSRHIPDKPIHIDAAKPLSPAFMIRSAVSIRHCQLNVKYDHYPYIFGHFANVKRLRTLLYFTSSAYQFTVALNRSIIAILAVQTEASAKLGVTSYGLQPSRFKKKRRVHDHLESSI